MKKITVLLHLILFFCTNCKREKSSHNIVKGIVYNNCTNKGIEGVKVFLNDNHGLNLSTQSDMFGNFIFENVETSNKYKTYNYQLFIPSESGISGYNKATCRFDGDLVNFNLSEINNVFELNVTPGFLNLCFNPTVAFPIIQPDSIFIHFEQKIIKNKFPNMPASGKITNQSTFSTCPSNYPMGWWYFYTQKWKSGVYSTKTDSLYLDWGGTNTYTINW